MLPADGSSTRGGSTSVHRRVRTPLVAKLQCAAANSQCAIVHVWPYGTFVALANLRYTNALNKNNNNNNIV